MANLNVTVAFLGETEEDLRKMDHLLQVTASGWDCRPEMTEALGMYIFKVSQLSSKNLKIKINKTITLPCVLYVCETRISG